jgi:ABC-type polysaccharide/polyol phosphate export permease
MTAVAEPRSKPISENRRSRELLWSLTMREVSGRYKRTALGNLWSLVNPVATMVIYSIVFGILLRVMIEPSRTGLDVFALWLVCALLPWTFLANAVSGGLDAILGNANLVKKVYFRREVLVGSTVLALDVTFLTEMAVVAVALLIAGNMVLPWIPMVLVLVVLLTVFAMGIALALSVANIYFRDTKHFVAIFLQVWMYLTPIIYPISYIAQAQTFVNARLAPHGISIPMETLWNLNPMLHFTNAFRTVMYELAWPSQEDMVWCVASAVVSLALGWLVFRRFRDRLAEEL